MVWLVLSEAQMRMAAPRANISRNHRKTRPRTKPRVRNGRKEIAVLVSATGDRRRDSRMTTTRK